MYECFKLSAYPDYPIPKCIPGTFKQINGLKYNWKGFKSLFVTPVHLDLL